MWSGIDRLERHPRWTLGAAVLLAALLLALDYGTGLVVQFSMAFLVPVSIAAWVTGKGWGIALALALTLARILLRIELAPRLPPALLVTNFLLLSGVLSTFAVLVDSVARQHRALRREADALQRLLPMCAWCKAVRLEDGSFASIEEFLLERGRQTVTSTICPRCEKKYFG